VVIDYKRTDIQIGGTAIEISTETNKLQIHISSLEINQNQDESVHSKSGRTGNRFGSKVAHDARFQEAK
jgi:hypothetical protein